MLYIEILFARLLMGYIHVDSTHEQSDFSYCYLSMILIHSSHFLDWHWQKYQSISAVIVNICLKVKRSNQVTLQGVPKKFF